MTNQTLWDQITKLREDNAALHREIMLLKDSRAAAVDQEQLSRVECNQLRQELAVAKTKIDNLTESMSEIVSPHTDPLVGAPWMRCSPDLPQYIQNIWEERDNLRRLNRQFRDENQQFRDSFRRLSPRPRAALSLAAMHLCREVTTHPIECTCESCKAACNAVPYLPTLAPEFKEQFARRSAVQKVSS